MNLEQYTKQWVSAAADFAWLYDYGDGYTEMIKDITERAERKFNEIYEAKRRKEAREFFNSLTPEQVEIIESRYTKTEI